MAVHMMLPAPAAWLARDAQTCLSLTLSLCPLGQTARQSVLTNTYACSNCDSHPFSHLPTTGFPGELFHCTDANVQPPTASSDLIFSAGGWGI
ncbi:hypothetical protein ABBQ32_008663 [Trebouxia sp. C0010 RCD-2024]